MFSEIMLKSVRWFGFISIRTLPENYTTGQFRGKVSLVQTSMSMFLSSMKCLYTLLCSLIEYTMFHEVYLHYTLYTN